MEDIKNLDVSFNGKITQPVLESSFSHKKRKSQRQSSSMNPVPIDSDEEFDPAELKLLPVLAQGRTKNQIAA